MDLLDRMLGHDAWMTREVLQSCRDLPAETAAEVRRIIGHMTYNVAAWTADLLGQPLLERWADRAGVDAMMADWDAHYAVFAAAARAVAAADAWDDLCPADPEPRTKGGVIGHVVTHNMHHRSELIRLLKRAGIADVPEGDLLSWECHVAQEA